MRTPILKKSPNREKFVRNRALVIAMSTLFFGFAESTGDTILDLSEASMTVSSSSIPNSFINRSPSSSYFVPMANLMFFSDAGANWYYTTDNVTINPLSTVIDPNNIGSSSGDLVLTSLRDSFQSVGYPGSALARQLEILKDAGLDIIMNEPGNPGDPISDGDTVIRFVKNLLIVSASDFRARGGLPFASSQIPGNATTLFSEQPSLIDPPSGRPGDEGGPFFDNTRLSDALLLIELTVAIAEAEGVTYETYQTGVHMDHTAFATSFTTIMDRLIAAIQ